MNIPGVGFMTKCKNPIYEQVTVNILPISDRFIGHGIEDEETRQLRLSEDVAEINHHPYVTICNHVYYMAAPAPYSANNIHLTLYVV